MIKRRTTAIITMFLTLLTVFIMTFPGLSVSAGDPDPSCDEITLWHMKPFETIDKGDISGYRYFDPTFTGATLVIRTNEEWLAFWDMHTSHSEPQPAAPYVNFEYYMVLVALGGFKPSTGYSISFDLLLENINDDVTVAFYHEMSPGKDCIVGHAITNPYHIIKTRKTSEVYFCYLGNYVYDCGYTSFPIFDGSNEGLTDPGGSGNIDQYLKP